MARKSPSGRAATRVPPQITSTGPSRKPEMPAVKKPAPGNLGAAIKRTSDKPKG
jgi:hypothetical protein